MLLTVSYLTFSNLERRDFKRDAVFFLMRLILADLSSVWKTWDKVSGEGDFL